MTTPLFPLGRTVATRGAFDALYRAKTVPSDLLSRHESGDWDHVPPGDARENEFSAQHGFRIFSSYTLSTKECIWIITEYDRSLTTLLLPSEY
jgi:hypothetical protein